MNKGRKPSLPVSFSSGLKPPKAKGLRKLFRSKALLPEETAEWIFEVYGWLLSNLGGYEEFQKTSLLLPTDDFFPGTLSDDPAVAAQVLFKSIIEHARLQDWKITLAPLDAAPTTTDLLGDDVAFGISANTNTMISGLQRTGDEILVQYAPHLTQNPEAFIAAIVYELGHALVLTFASDDDELPGVDKLEGPLLEIVVTFLGFGVFSANAVYNFERFRNLRTEGWSVQSLGELSEIEVSYSLALFLALKGEGVAQARGHLGANPKAYVKKAWNEIARERSAHLAELRAL